MNTSCRLVTRVLPLSLSLIATFAAAKSAAESAPHEHGVGHLNVAIEGDEIEIELMAPGADLVGFEHDAATPEKEAAVATAMAILSAGEKLFAFPESAGCRLEEAEVGDDHLDGHDADHGMHDHDVKDEDEEEHDHAHDEDEQHSEFHAHYHFECKNMKAVSYLETRYFESFPNTRELEAQFITPQGQGAAVLTPANPRLGF
ncbi:MAG: DUF2796 domain-containing protein [Magnetospiraceae bacterium]